MNGYIIFEIYVRPLIGIAVLIGGVYYLLSGREWQMIYTLTIYLLLQGVYLVLKAKAPSLPEWVEMVFVLGAFVPAVLVGHKMAGKR